MNEIIQPGASKFAGAGRAESLRLYVAGDSADSALAMANIEGICRDCLGDNATLEVVDVTREPRRALEAGILVTPTLLRLGDRPLRVIGNLSDRHRVLTALGLRERGR